MSTHEEILAVYNQEITDKVKIVYNKCGSRPFYDGYDGFRIECLYDGLGIDKIICSEYTPKSKRMKKCL